MPALLVPRHTIISPAVERKWAEFNHNPTQLETMRQLLALGSMGRRVAKFSWLNWLNQPSGVYLLSLALLANDGAPTRVWLEIFDYGPTAAAIVGVYDREIRTPASFYGSEAVFKEAKLLYREIEIVVG